MKLFAALLCLPLSMGLLLTGDSWNICEGHPGKISQVDFAPCAKEPCDAQVGTAYTIKATFEPTHDTASDCTLKGMVLIGGAWFDLLEDFACGTNVACPLKKGQSTVFTKTIPISDKLSPGKQTTRWKLICNSNADEIFCADLSFNVIKK